MNRKTIFTVFAIAAIPLIFVLRGLVRSKAVAAIAKTDATPSLADLGTAIREARETTSAAFVSHASDEEYADLDSAAKAAFAKLQTAFAEARASMPAELRAVCESFIDLASDAQMQRMAFAINRKNRTTDGAQDEAETFDLVKFRTGVSGLSEQLASAFSKVGVDL